MDNRVRLSPVRPQVSEACELVLNLQIDSHVYSLYPTSYEQADISKSLKFALEHAVNAGADLVQASGLVADNLWNVSYLMRYLKDKELRAYDTGDFTDIQNLLAQVVETFVNVDLVIADLYGESISLRCWKCHDYAGRGMGTISATLTVVISEKS